jgi:flavodoxin
MKALVVYDSKFGNTEVLAREIAQGLGGADALFCRDVRERELEGVDLLVVGGPTQGHGLSPDLRTFLDRLAVERVKDMRFAAFDTRLTWPRLLAGSAAAQAAKRLTKKGAHMLVGPESFLVKEGKGPLLDGELSRAKEWAMQVGAAAGLVEPEMAGAL